MPTYTVILPTFQRNKSGLLAKAIRSVLAQSYGDFELLVVDDGSVDGSKETIEEFVSVDSRITHIRFEENQGLPALTSLQAFLGSSGKYLAWMFDDCVWEESFLEEMHAELEKRPDVAIAYADCSAHFEDIVRLSGGEFNPEAILSGNNHIPNIATVIRTELYGQIGWYDPRVALVRLNDWDFIYRATKFGVKFHHHPYILAHEFGADLGDSLGNVYGFNPDLVREITSCDRNVELLPKNAGSIDVLSLPAGLHLDEELLREYLRLLIEFAVRGWRTTYFDRISKATMFSDLGIPLSDISSQIRWWAAENSKQSMKTLQRNHDFIMNQQIEIDKKQAFIDATQRHIAQQDALISSLQDEIRGPKTRLKICIGKIFRSIKGFGDK